MKPLKPKRKVSKKTNEPEISIISTPGEFISSESFFYSSPGEKITFSINNEGKYYISEHVLRNLGNPQEVLELLQKIINESK